MARSPAVRRIAIGVAIGVLAVAAIGPTDYRAAVASSVGGGALVAAVALGLVLTHRSSGVVNFANAAMATYGAYVFMGLRRQGELFLPPLPNPLAVLEGLLHAVGFSQVALPDLPTSLSFGAPLTFSSCVRAQPRGRRAGRAAHARPRVPAAAPRSTAGEDCRVGRAAAGAPVGCRPALHFAGCRRQAAVREASRPRPRHVVSRATS